MMSRLGVEPALQSLLIMELPILPPSPALNTTDPFHDPVWPCCPQLGFALLFLVNTYSSFKMG